MNAYAESTRQPRWCSHRTDLGVHVYSIHCDLDIRVTTWDLKLRRVL